MIEREIPIAEETKQYMNKMNTEKKKPMYFEDAFIIDDHIYQDHLSIVFTDKLRKSIKDQCKFLGFKKKRGKRYVPGHSAAAVVCHVSENAEDNNTGKYYGGKWVVFDINRFNDGIVVHECLHLVHSLMGYRRLKLSNKTEEAYAYAIQYYFNKIMACWEELKPRIEEYNKEHEKDS